MELKSLYVCVECSHVQSFNRTAYGIEMKKVIPVNGVYLLF